MTISPDFPVTTITASNQLYEQDFYAWTVATAVALKSGNWQKADLANLIEEVEAMGRSEKAGFVDRHS